MSCAILMQKWSRKKQDLEHVAANVLKLQRQKIVRSELQRKKAFSQHHFESGFCLNGIKKCGCWAAAILEPNCDIFLPKSIA